MSSCERPQNHQEDSGPQQHGKYSVHDPGKHLQTYQAWQARYAGLCENVPYAGCLVEEICRHDPATKIANGILPDPRPLRGNFTSTSVADLKIPPKIRLSRANVTLRDLNSSKAAESIDHVTRIAQWNRGEINERTKKSENFLGAPNYNSFQMDVLCQSQFPRQRNDRRGPHEELADDYCLPHLVKHRCRSSTLPPKHRPISQTQYDAVRALVDPPAYITEDRRRQFPEKMKDTSAMLRQDGKCRERLSPTSRIGKLQSGFQNCGSEGMSKDPMYSALI
eukprot:Selendium_serpulae@DN2425_c0_g1_i1.p1